MANGYNDIILLQNLPSIVLEKIFNYLPFSSMFELSKTCVTLREVAIRKMKIGFMKLMPIITSKYLTIEERFITVNEGRINNYEECCYLHRILTVLEMLLSEVRIINVVIGRYENYTNWNYFGGKSGELLDLIYNIINNYLTATSTDVAVILEKNDKFLFKFIMNIEPQLNNKSLPFGVKIVDILNCARNFNLKSKVYYSHYGTLNLNGKYKFYNITHLMFPFDIYSYGTIDEMLQYFLYVLIINVRYYNYCYWEKSQRAIEEIPHELLNRIEFKHLNEHHHKTSTHEIIKCNISHDTIPWYKISPSNFISQMFIENNSNNNGFRCSKCFSFSCKFNLKTNDYNNFPLAMPVYNSIYLQRNKPLIYDFTFELRMTHLAESSLSNVFQIKTSQIKIWSYCGGHQFYME
ncbi:hypothetical protein O3M35_010662 [Rhynocoris fuscipes]|uniref:F-box domain-containing protein n=1 Tax=Rhynocoris fuscipes TaxID=488301 RepID=A0AAW1D5V8_9HEMI